MTTTTKAPTGTGTTTEAIRYYCRYCKMEHPLPPAEDYEARSRREGRRDSSKGEDET